MNDFQDLFIFEPDSWIEALPSYQRDAVASLFEISNDYESVAFAWISASPSNTVQYGAQKKDSIFLSRIYDELELFFSEDKKYEKEVLELKKYNPVVQLFVVSTISSFLSPYLGVTAVFLAPVIAILLASIARIGVQAWLSQRKEQKQKDRKDV